VKPLQERKFGYKPNVSGLENFARSTRPSVNRMFISGYKPSGSGISKTNKELMNTIHWQEISILLSTAQWKGILNYQNNIHVKHDSVSILSSLLHQGKYTEFIGHTFFNRNSTGQLSQETHFGHVLET